MNESIDESARELTYSSSAAYIISSTSSMTLRFSGNLSRSMRRLVTDEDGDRWREEQSD